MGQLADHEVGQLLRLGVASEFGEFTGQERAVAAREAGHSCTVCGWHRPQCRVTWIRPGAVLLVDHQSGKWRGPRRALLGLTLACR